MRYDTILDIIETENFQPNRWDFIPIDFSLWGVLRQTFYCQKIRDIDHVGPTPHHTLSYELLDDRPW